MSPTIKWFGLGPFRVCKGLSLFVLQSDFSVWVAAKTNRYYSTFLFLLSDILSFASARIVPLNEMTFWQSYLVAASFINQLIKNQELQILGQLMKETEESSLFYQEKLEFLIKLLAYPIELLKKLFSRPLCQHIYFQQPNREFHYQFQKMPRLSKNIDYLIFCEQLLLGLSRVIYFFWRTLDG